jgi:hypothetical protein
MTALRTTPQASPSRRERAARVVVAALRGGLVGTVAAGLAWLAAAALAGTAWFVLIVATIAAVAILAWRGDLATWIWLALAAGWAALLLERAIVQENGGVWVALAGWFGVVLGARRAGISKWALPLLAYPALSLAVVIVAGEDVLDPWGTSWLWLLAVLGPIVGARTLLRPAEEKPRRP